MAASVRPHRPAPVAPSASLLRLSAAGRLAIAAGLAGAMWLLVWWALA